MRPDLETSAGLEVVKDAILRATRPGEKGDFAQVCRVFGPDRRPVALSDTIARPGRLSLSAPCPDPAGLPLRSGRWLFGGIGFLHFGHALIFSTARLWALDHMKGAVDGILYFDRSTRHGTRSGTSRHVEAILALLGIDLPVVTVGQDERVEELVVAEAGISTSADLFAGTEGFRAFIRRRLCPAPGSVPSAHVPETHLYVSRLKLGYAKTGLMFEDRIETLMAAAGYQVFYPERSSLEDQVALYRRAARIVGVDGSALHLAAFAAPASAQVAILGRRPYFPEALAGQFRAFSGASACVLRPPTQIFRPPGHVETSDAWTASYSLPDFPSLERALADAGFLAAARGGWTNPTQEELDARIRLISRRSGRSLASHPADRLPI
ncbi:MAG: glycosyltransferase family 61 protein [Tabrizicola sp.]|nr:glycosyltransferase family 61 protein [Tabrizicola sp.]